MGAGEARIRETIDPDSVGGGGGNPMGVGHLDGGGHPVEEQDLGPFAAAADNVGDEEDRRVGG